MTRLVRTIGALRKSVHAARYRWRYGILPNGNETVHLVLPVRNEGPYLVEWLAHHRLIGATAVTVFSNDCADGTEQMLNRWHELGLITHLANPIPPGGHAQKIAINRAQELPDVRASDWVMIMDADEFISVHTGDGSLQALIRAAGGSAIDAISLNWRLMGSNRHFEFDNAPLANRFTRGNQFNPPESGRCRSVKTLFRPLRLPNFRVHRPFGPGLYPHIPPRWVNGGGVPFPKPTTGRAHGPPRGIQTDKETTSLELAHIHHYAVKSRAEFLVKRDRAALGGRFTPVDWDYWCTGNLNSVVDETRRRTGLADAMAELRADPEIARYEHQAIAWHRSRAAKLAEVPQNARFLSGAFNPKHSKGSNPRRRKAAKDKT